MYIRVVWFIVVSIGLAFSGCNGTARHSDNRIISLKEKVEAAGIPANLLSIHISKTDYTLQVRYDTIVFKSYPVVLGGDPINDKLRQGDRCTPEGIFRVKALYPHKKWSKFIWIDYPNEKSWEKHRAAKARGEIPDDANIGGEIGIHGVEMGYDYAIDEKMNWTLGCISLKNKDVNEIYEVVIEGTVVEIVK